MIYNIVDTERLVSDKDTGQIRVILHAKESLSWSRYRPGSKSAHGGPADAEAA